MDPLTLLATAKAAHSAIKTAISLGKDIQSTAKDLSSLWSSVAGLTKAASEPPKKGWVNAGSAEAQALEIFAAKKEAEQLQLDIQNYIVGEWGLFAWESIQREVVRIRKQQKEAALKAQKEREEMMDGLYLWGGLFVFILIVAAMIFTTIMIIR
jgi:hypothetical protein